MGTQKKRLNETFFEHQKHMGKENNHNFTLIKCPYLDLCIIIIIIIIIILKIANREFKDFK